MSVLVTRWKTDPEKHRLAASSAYRCWTLICFFMSGCWMCYDTSTFCTEVWIIHTRTCWRQPVTAARPGCNQRLDSGWTESLNRVTCKLCENREQHRSLIIRDRGVCCSYSSYHPVARIERAEPDRKRWRGKATRKRHETRGQEVSRRGTSWPRRVQSTGWTSCRSGRQEPTARRTHWGQPLREERRGEAERQRRLFQA